MVSRQASGSPSKVRPERGERVLKTRSKGMRAQCGRRRMRGHGVLTPPSGAASWTGPCPSADAGCASAPEGSRRGGTGRGGGGAPPCRGMDHERGLDVRKRLPTAREGSLWDDGTGWNPKGSPPPVSPAVVSTSVLLEVHGKGHWMQCFRFLRHGWHAGQDGGDPLSCFWSDGRMKSGRGIRWQWCPAGGWKERERGGWVKEEGLPGEPCGSERDVVVAVVLGTADGVVLRSGSGSCGLLLLRLCGGRSCAVLLVLAVAG